MLTTYEVIVTIFEFLYKALLKFVFYKSPTNINECLVKELLYSHLAFRLD